MAVVALLAPQTAAGSATTFTCNGVTRKPVGIYTTSNATFTERAAVELFVTNPAGTVPARRDDGTVIILTADRPTAMVETAGTYTAVKSATLQAVGVWTDDGA